MLCVLPLVITTAFGLAASSQGSPAISSRRADPTKTMEFLRSKGALSRDMDGKPVRPQTDEMPGSILPDPVPSGECKWRAVVTDVIDDMRAPFPATPFGTEWAKSTDRVMGGVSDASVARESFDGRPCNVLRGRVDTANNGGFVQMGVDLSPDGTPIDARQWDGLELVARCPRAERYNVHLRTPDCARVFSTYRASFDVGTEWTTVRVPFASFEGNGPGASEIALDVSRLRRLGLLGLGRDFDADLALASIRFYAAE